MLNRRQFLGLAVAGVAAAAMPMSLSLPPDANIHAAAWDLVLGEWYWIDHGPENREQVRMMLVKDNLEATGGGGLRRYLEFYAPRGKAGVTMSMWMDA